MRSREVQIKFFLSEDEKEFLEKKMLTAGTKNKSAYMRKMALDGYIIHQDFAQIKNAVYELNKVGVNINQSCKWLRGCLPIRDKKCKKEIKRIASMLAKLIK